MGTSAEHGTGAQISVRGVRTRKRRSIQEKLRIVQETLSDESVVVVARRHGINANQLFAWRRQYQRGALKGGPAARRGLRALDIRPSCQISPRPQPLQSSAKPASQGRQAPIVTHSKSRSAKKLCVDGYAEHYPCACCNAHCASLRRKSTGTRAHEYLGRRQAVEAHPAAQPIRRRAPNQK